MKANAPSTATVTWLEIKVSVPFRGMGNERNRHDFSDFPLLRILVSVPFRGMGNESDFCEFLENKGFTTRFPSPFGEWVMKV
jgi:hypothetical protein